MTLRFVAGPALIVAIGVGIAACGGYGGPAPTTPDGGNPAPPSGAIVIDILGENGALSFSPNPATVASGSSVVWHNRDRETHRVLLDDRGLDTGNIAAGAFSQPMTLRAPGPYHCTIHPSMVGRTQEGS